MGCKENVSGTVTDKYIMRGENIFGSIIAVEYYFAIEDSNGIKYRVLVNEKDFKTIEIGAHIEHYGHVWKEF